MPRLRVDPRFASRFHKLDARVQHRVKKALQRFIEAPARKGANLESITGSPGPYYTLRATANFRIVLRREEDGKGEVFTVVDVGPHDIYRKYSR
jgi:hypothetical protein